MHCAFAISLVSVLLCELSVFKIGLAAGNYWEENAYDEDAYYNVKERSHIPEAFDAAESIDCPTAVSISPNYVTVGDTLTCYSDSNPDPQYTWKNLATGDVTVGQTLKVTEEGEQSYMCTATVATETEQCDHSSVIKIQPINNKALTARELQETAFGAQPAVATEVLAVKTAAGFGTSQTSTGDRRTIIDCSIKGTNVVWKVKFQHLFPKVIVENCEVKASEADTYDVDTSAGGCNLIVKKTLLISTKYACYEGGKKAVAATVAEIGPNENGVDDVSIAGACWGCNYCISWCIIKYQPN